MASANMAQPPEPRRSQSTTSLAQFYHGAPGNGVNGEEEISDPRMDFCNAFWGQGDRGYEVIMARMRGAGRTVDELRGFWKERALIEEDYAKRLNKLSKFSLGRDEIGDLAASLQNVLAETAQQASYHQALSTELKQGMEQPTAESGVRLGNLKKGLQGSVERSYRNKGLQEGHVLKAKERYESDCLKLNSYTANSQLVQGKELDKLQSKLDRVRQTIGANEQDFRQFVRVLEGTTGKWEQEWKAFCDHAQDMEEDRLAMTKDIIWAYANAVSQVCVEDDSSCERVREKLEQFEPQSDMVTFVRGWGTGDSIPDPPRFVNYSAGEYQPPQPVTHPANFRRISSKPPMSARRPAQEAEAEPEQEPDVPSHYALANGHGAVPNGRTGQSPRNYAPEQPAPVPPPVSEPQQPAQRQPFGGVALPGMAAVSAIPALAQALPQRNSSMAPPPVPPTMTMPEPRIPSRQGPPSPMQRDVTDEEDPMAKALADLRRDPPPPGSVRRNASHRRPESFSTPSGSVRGGAPMQDMRSPTSPAPNADRMSYQQPPTHTMPSAQSKSSIDMTLSPPASGHTAAALAKSMDDFQRQSTRGPEKRQSTNYCNFADDVVGAHPTSRPASPAGIQRGPSPAMMQPPRQPPSPVTDEVLSQYHQAFPGERSRSRAGSDVSGRSRAGSTNGPAPNNPQKQATSSSAPPREAFAGIGAGGGRSPSPQPPQFHSPSPSPVVQQGALGPQNIGIKLDEKGGVAHDSMAEAYRRQYQQQHGHEPPQQQDAYSQQPQQYGSQRQSQYGQQSDPKSPSADSHSGRPTSAAFTPQQFPQQPSYGQPPHPRPQAQPQLSQQISQRYGRPPQQQYQQYPSQPQQQQFPSYSQPPQQTQQQQPSYQPSQKPQQPQQQQQQQHPMSPQSGYGPSTANGYSLEPQQRQSYVAPQVQTYPTQNQNQYARTASPAPYQQNSYARAASPAPQQNAYGRGPSPAPHQPPPSQQNYGYHTPSPQPQRIQRSPSPQPGVPPSNAAPTGQWATNGLPVLFYVKALYDYGALSGAEFDFQAGDIIAVTSTPEDGWWSGELLDEARRVPGRNDFPSNFVCLF